MYSGIQSDMIWQLAWVYLKIPGQPTMSILTEKMISKMENVFITRYPVSVFDCQTLT